MILGLSGKSQAGKDTVADYLVSHKGWTRKAGFADKLKQVCKLIFDLSDYQVRSQEGKRSSIQPIRVGYDHLKGILACMQDTHKVFLGDKEYRYLIGKELTTPREVLQFVGTDVMRWYCENYHYENLLSTATPGEKLVITDVRFPNECMSILNKPGFLVRVNRLEGIISNNWAKSHLSESALDFWPDWSYILYNNGTSLNRLFKAADEMLRILEVEKNEYNS